jgi:uncharacterized protein (DUF1015 family)
MAVIRPFRGVRYNTDRVPNVGLVVTQPYDRIGPELHRHYLQQHPRSFVQLILADADPHSSQAGNPYAGVAPLYRSWLQEGVLIRAQGPALYVYHQTFNLPDGTLVTRRAFIGGLQLTPFEEGIVLPHERTLSAPKADRLNLFRATQVSFEPIFLLYSDPTNRINVLLDAAIGERQPDVDVRESFENDVRQQLWEINDTDVIAAVPSAMAPERRLIVADGHHRYETALTYRDEMRAAHPDAPADAGFNFALVAFVSIDDPGLTILPTHRLVHSYVRMTAEEVEAAAAEYFAIRPLGTPADRARMATALQESGRNGTAFGFITPSRQSVWTLRSHRTMDELAPERSSAWRKLDVAVLHQLVLERIMGLTPESIARQENLTYLRDAEEGRHVLERGKAQFLFQLNPTRIEQVRACAEAGEQMPQKSTDFYPKMISGLVIMEL